jgi:aspartyl-tRNA(Asn)/glutamyl-tRNA(Gln) amidotransferase subunit B
MKLEIVIGLEIHVQLKTKSKMFCSCANEFDIVEPNKNICPICTGQPGVLPKTNAEAVRLALKAALALNLKINTHSKFDRKSYFYPDLPKAYQISQYDQPLAQDGYLEIYLAGGEKKFGIERLHLEEDAAKNTHADEYALIDFNRAGTPLVEIVTKPDFTNPQEAKAFLQELRSIMRLLHVSDADMEKGQLRCDANISLRPVGDTQLYAKTEIKNLNSFRGVEKALEHEVRRQIELWEKGEKPDISSTRGWDEIKNITLEQRIKEEASDYRYFPEPDLPPLVVLPLEIDKAKSEIPELPNEKRIRLMNEYGFKLLEVNILMSVPGFDIYAEKVISEFLAWLKSSDSVEGTTGEIHDQYQDKITKLVTNWLINNLLQLMNKHQQAVTEIKITPENFAEFLTLIFNRRVNSSAAQIILEQMYITGKDPSDLIDELDLHQTGSNDISVFVTEVISENAIQVEQYKQGKTVVLKFLIGLVMKKSKGKADPQVIEELLTELLSK